MGIVNTSASVSLVLRGWTEDGDLRMLVTTLPREAGHDPRSRLATTEAQVLRLVQRWIAEEVTVQGADADGGGDGAATDPRLPGP